MADTTRKMDIPKLACEITPELVIAARLAADGSSVDAYSSRRAESAGITPGLGHANVRSADDLRDAISGALGSLAGGSRDVIAVLPDAAVRVLLVDFDTLPDDPNDAKAILRFRVKKSLPFDVEHAAVAYHAQRSNGTVKVVAAFAPHSVVQEYEQAFRDAGYQPGVVTSSSLATLGLVEDDQPTMLVKLDRGASTVSIADRGELLLIRTQEWTSASPDRIDKLMDSVHPSIVFFEDTFGRKIEQLAICGENAREIAAELQSQTGIGASEFAATSITGSGFGDTVPASMLTGVAGALLG